MKLIIAVALLMSSRVFASGIEVRMGDLKSAAQIQVPGESLKIGMTSVVGATGKDFGDFQPVAVGSDWVVRAWLLPTGLEKLQHITNDRRDDVFDNKDLPNDVQSKKQHEFYADEHWVCLYIEGLPKDCHPMSKLREDLKMDAKNNPMLIRRGFQITGFKKQDEAVKYAKKLFDTRAAEFKPMRAAAKPVAKAPPKSEAKHVAPAKKKK